MTDRVDLPHDAWVVVADGEKALFLRNEGDEKFPNLQVFREEQQDNPPDRQQGADKSGRFNDGPNVHRSAVEETDWHQLEKTRFARDLSDILFRQVHKHKFRHLVICAPPATLGDMRKVLHQEVLETIIAEIDKTLTNHPVHEIESLVVGKK